MVFISLLYVLVSIYAKIPTGSRWLHLEYFKVSSPKGLLTRVWAGWKGTPYPHTPTRYKGMEEEAGTGGPRAESQVEKQPQEKLWSQVQEHRQLKATAQGRIQGKNVYTSHSYPCGLLSGTSTGRIQLEAKGQGNSCIRSAFWGKESREWLWREERKRSGTPS